MTLTQKLSSIKALADGASSAVSDDFGHDCEALANWQVGELYVLCEHIPKMIAVIEKLKAENLRLKNLISELLNKVHEALKGGADE